VLAVCYSVMYGTIYFIWCWATSKGYVGQTTQDLKQRWHGYLTESIDKNTPIIRAVRKYGREAFDIYEISCAGSQEELDRLEVEYVAKLGTLTRDGRGYNVFTGGNGGGKRVVCRNGLHDVTQLGSRDVRGVCKKCRSIYEKRKFREKRESEGRPVLGPNGKKDFCKRGHDLNAVGGRTKAGSCRLCENARARISVMERYYKRAEEEGRVVKRHDGICKYGHSLNVEGGRTKDGKCRLCVNNRARAAYTGKPKKFWSPLQE